MIGWIICLSLFVSHVGKISGLPDEFYDGTAVSIWITSFNEMIAEENITFTNDPSQNQMSFNEIKENAGFCLKNEKVEFEMIEPYVNLNDGTGNIPGIKALIELLQKMEKLNTFAFTGLVPHDFVYYFLDELRIFNKNIKTIYITECYKYHNEVIKFPTYFDDVSKLIVRNASMECFMEFKGIIFVSLTNNAIFGIEPELFYSSTLKFITDNESTLKTVQIITIEKDLFWRFALALCNFNLDAEFSLKYYFTAVSYHYVEYKTFKYLLPNNSNKEAEEKFERRMKLATNALGALIPVILFYNSLDQKSKQITIQSIEADICWKVLNDDWTTFKQFIIDHMEHMQQGKSIELSFVDETFQLLFENVDEFMKNDGDIPYAWQFLATIKGNVLPKHESTLKSLFKHEYLQAITFVFTSSDEAEAAKIWNSGTGWECGVIDSNTTNGILFVTDGGDNGDPAEVSI